MKELKNSNEYNKVNAEIGSAYDVKESIRLGGTGSPKMVYVGGIEFFGQSEKLGATMNRFNFELYPNGLIGHYNKSNRVLGCVIKRTEIESISFISRRILMPRKLRADKLVHDAKVILKLTNGESIQIYTPIKLHKQAKNFFTKDWLEKATDFSEDPAKPIKYERTEFEQLLLELLDHGSFFIE